MSDQTLTDAPAASVDHEGEQPKDNRRTGIAPWLGIVGLVIAIVILVHVLKYLLVGVAVGLGIAIGVTLFIAGYSRWSQRDSAVRKA